jgi:hypothetical protein
MNSALVIIRWIVAVPAAIIGSDFIGMLLGFLTLGIRHVGGKIFGDSIEVLRKPFAVIDNFIIGMLFVAIGLLTVPTHNLEIIVAFAAIKAWVDYVRRSVSNYPEVSTGGAVFAAVALSYFYLTGKP